MSAPDTNIAKQERRHKGPLIGMALAVIFAFGLLAALMVYIADDGGVPQGADVQIDGRTGAAVVVEEPATVTE